MGGGQTKEKQLDRFGQLLSTQEKIAISASFQAIAGSREVNFFVESQLQVGVLGGQHVCAWRGCVHSV